MGDRKFPAEPLQIGPGAALLDETHADSPKVLVTGGSGFVGRACAEFLRARRADVIAPPSRDLNLLDNTAVRRFLDRSRPTHLLHAAWRPVRGDIMVSPENVIWQQASLSLLQAFHAAGGRRAAFVGSCAEYDWSHGTCRTGITPLNPASAYGKAKNALRIAACSYAMAAGLSLVWPRVFFVYGPREHESRLSAYVLNSLLRGQPAELTHGEQIRDYLYIRDVAEGVVAALFSGIEGEIDIASGQRYTLRNIVTEIAKQVGRQDLLRLGARPAPAHDVQSVVSDTSHARAHLNWIPRTSLDAGVAELVTWGRKVFTKVGAAIGGLDLTRRFIFNAFSPDGPMTMLISC